VVSYTFSCPSLKWDALDSIKNEVKIVPWSTHIDSIYFKTGVGFEVNFWDYLSGEEEETLRKMVEASIKEVGASPDKKIGDSCYEEARKALLKCSRAEMRKLFGEFKGLVYG